MFCLLRRGPFLLLRRHTRSHEDLAKQQAAAADPESTPNMDEGLAAQLLGLSCAPGSGLHGGRVPGDGDPFGALGGLLADMLPAGEEVLRRIGTSAGGAAWFPPPSKTLPHPEPTLTSPGASPQAGARRSPWDSFSSLASANGTAHGTAKGAVNGTGSGTASGIIGQLHPVPLGKAMGGNSTSAGGEAAPCTPPTLQQAALWASKTSGGNPAQGITAKSRADLLWGNGNGSAVQAANDVCQDHDQASVLCGGPRRGRRGHSACAGLACGCMAGSGFELAPAHGLSASSSCSSFVTAGSVSDDDDDIGFVEMLDAAASPTPNPNPPATLTEHLSVAIAELAAGRAVEGHIGFENPNTSPGGSPSADEPAPFQENLRRSGLSLGPGPGFASPVAEPGGPQAAPGEVPPLGVERAHEARSSVVRDVDARGHTGTAPQRQRQRGCAVGLGGQDRRSGRLVRTHSVGERPTKSCLSVVPTVQYSPSHSSTCWRDFAW